MEDWIRERGYVMWLGALGLAASREGEAKDELERQAAGAEMWLQEEETKRSERQEELRASL